MRKLFFGLSAILIVAWPVGAQARDCDNNAIMRCGAVTKDELVLKLQGGDGVHSAAELQDIYYRDFKGISIVSIQSANTVDGVVKNDGTVWVGGKKVATGAMSTGRQFIGGSTQYGHNWIRPTSISFKQPALDAFVNLQGSRFQWAIIKSCGNPVIANAVTPPPVRPAGAIPPPTIVQPPPVVIPQTGTTGLGAGLGLTAVTTLTMALAASRRKLIMALLGS